MAKLADGGGFDRLDDLEAPILEVCSRGIRLSRITAKLKGSIDITPLVACTNALWKVCSGPRQLPPMVAFR